MTLDFGAENHRLLDISKFIYTFAAALVYAYGHPGDALNALA